MAKAKQSAPITAANMPVTLNTGDGLVLGASPSTLAPSGVKLAGSGVTLDGAPKQADADITDVDIEQVALDEANEVLAGFKERASRETQRYEDATDSEFWIALCFQTRAQKEEFLEKLGLLELGDKYLDGMAVAEVLGVKLESPIPPMPQIRIDQKLVQLATKLVRGG